MRYYIIAGERSGDLHGGNLIRALKKYDSEASVRGFGGEYMQEAGAELAVHYADMAVMGVVEWLFHLNKISRYIKKCKEDILQFRPDVVILIDYGGFNGQIARFGKKRGLRIFYYIPPKVWAWYQRRAISLKANVDRLFAILPFEKDFYKRKLNWDVDYVGNPVLDAVKAHMPDPDFLQKNGLSAGKPIVALLPGSRKQELLRIISTMVEVARSNAGYQYAVATVDNLDEPLYEPFKAIPSVKFIHNATYDLLKHAAAAIVVSGTATLETAALRVPQVVVYKTSPASYAIAKRLIKVPFISLVNLIAGKEVVKELIQENANVKSISAELGKIANPGKERDTMLSAYDEIIRRLDTGNSASENAARLMVNYLNSPQS